MIQIHKMMSWWQKLDKSAALHSRKRLTQIKMYNKRSKLFPESTNQLGKHAVQFGILP